MKMSFSVDGQTTTVEGSIDTNFKSRSGALVRFAKNGTDADYSELTSESYVCEILASRSLVAADSSGGELTLRCRGESFEVGKYICK